MLLFLGHPVYIRSRIFKSVATAALCVDPRGNINATEFHYGIKIFPKEIQKRIKISVSILREDYYRNLNNSADLLGQNKIKSTVITTLEKSHT